MIVLGIDPGLEGGFAILDGDSVVVEPMPQGKDGKLDVQELARLLAHYAPRVTRCYLERVGSRPGQGSVSTFTFGKGYGILIGLLVALGVRYEEVLPQVWSKHYEHGITEREPNKRQRLIKAARRDIVATLYPGIDLKKTARSTVFHEGMVDALLIADYGWRLNKQYQLGEEPTA